MVSPRASQSSPSSSAMSAKTSGSSSSGVKAEIQHKRAGSKIMFPTRRTPDANEPAGEPGAAFGSVISAGRVEVKTASKSRKTDSLPSHLRDFGFHFMSPMTAKNCVRINTVRLSRRV